MLAPDGLRGFGRALEINGNNAAICPSTFKPRFNSASVSSAFLIQEEHRVISCPISLAIWLSNQRIAVVHSIGLLSDCNNFSREGVLVGLNFLLNCARVRGSP